MPGSFETNLFDDDLLPADLVGRIVDAYRERLLLNPPTPSFNTRTNDRAEAFAAKIAPKDITRFLAVLDDLNLRIVMALPDGAGHGES